MNQKKILVAIDGSKHSRRVIEETIEYVDLLSGVVLLVYCHTKFPSTIEGSYRDEEISKIIIEAENLIKPFLLQLENNNIIVEERLMEEPAGTMISEVARIEKCDLIIMGSRGLTNLASLIIGSVTNSVLQTAPCSVLVVK